MQSQMVQFFDIKSISAANRLNHTANSNQTNGTDFRNAVELTLNSTFSNDTMAANLTIQNNNVTNAIVDGVIETSTTLVTPITLNDVQIISDSGLRVTRKRKRTATTVYNHEILPRKFHISSKLYIQRIEVWHFQFQGHFRRKRNHKFNTFTHAVDSNYMKLNFPYIDQSHYGSTSVNRDDLNLPINQVDRAIDVDFEKIRSNNRISASKFEFILSVVTQIVFPTVSLFMKENQFNRIWSSVANWLPSI